MIVSSDLENGLEDAEKRRPKSVAQAISNQQAINVRKERWRTVPPRLTLSPEIIPRHSGFVLTVVLLSIHCFLLRITHLILRTTV